MTPYNHAPADNGRCMLCQNIYPCPAVLKRSAHRIAAVKFTHRGDPDLAPVTCTCGWMGDNRDYAAHRRQPGRTTSVKS